MNVTRTICWLAAIGLTLGAPSLRADEPAPSAAAIRAAVTKSIPLLEHASRESLTQRSNCFTCHNQGLAIMALSTAKSRGFEIDDENLHTQIKATADFLAKNRERYLQGRGQGGHIDMAGYALWTLEVANWPADDTTSAVAEFFLQFQSDQEHYQPASHRPPSEHSFFTSSYVALRGIKTFGTKAQHERAEKRLAQVATWIRQTKAVDTEDRVFRLRALALLDASADELQVAAAELLESQREDGGWSQLSDLSSDAYAASTALLALHEASQLPVDSQAYRRGLAYLVAQQRDDGSWLVESRAKPFQAYYESGYPHGKHQFISMTAACWATRALALALPEQAAKP